MEVMVCRDNPDVDSSTNRFKYGWLFFSLLGLVGGIVGLVYVIIPSILNFDPDKLMWLIGMCILFLLVWIIGIYLVYDSWGNYFYYKGWKKDPPWSKHIIKKFWKDMHRGKLKRFILTDVIEENSIKCFVFYIHYPPWGAVLVKVCENELEEGRKILEKIGRELKEADIKGNVRIIFVPEDNGIKELRVEYDGKVITVEKKYAELIRFILLLNETPWKHYFNVVMGKYYREFANIKQ